MSDATKQLRHTTGDVGPLIHVAQRLLRRIALTDNGYCTECRADLSAGDKHRESCEVVVLRAALARAGQAVPS